MTQRLGSIFAIAWRAAVVLLVLQIASTSVLRYLTETADAPPPILANAFAHPFLVLHVAGGVTALVVGPLQFVGRIRRSMPAFHRATGRIYVGACIVSAPTGFMLALGTTAGPVAGAGFAILAVLWLLFTHLGWRSAVERRFAQHREWMIRSYAMTSTAITLRLMLPLAAVLGFEFEPAYRVIAWLSWMTNLALFELYLRRNRTSRSAYAKLATT